MGDLPRLGGGVRQAQGAFCVLARRAQGPSLILRRSVRAGHPHASAAPDTLSSAACLQTTSTRAWPMRVWAAGLGALATPRFASTRACAGGHLVDAEDYVDAVYMALAAAAHAQANAACDALVWNPPHGSGRRRLRGAWRPAQAWVTPRTLSSARLVDAEDYVDAVHMVLAAAARTRASAALCSATHACAGKTFSEAGSWQPSCFRRRHVGLEPVQGFHLEWNPKP